MKKLIYFLLLSGLITACADEPAPAGKPAPAAVKDTIISIDDIKPKTDIQERLTDKNIVPYLEKYGKENPETIVMIRTGFGNIKIRLYKDTPLHRANFIMLIKKGIYKNTQFSRVVKGFVIQGGSSNEPLAADLKFYLGTYMLPSEMSLKHIHKRGAVAMSRPYNGNPDKKSDAFDFYIVLGDKQGDASLYKIQKEKKIKYTPEQIKIYKTIGGTPHLDMEHTVFGEVVSGMNVVEKINKVPVDGREWPEEDVVINLEVIK